MQKDYKKELNELIKTVIDEGGSDLHISEGRRPTIRVSGFLIPLVKKDVFSKLGSHLLLKDRIIRIDMENTLIPLKAVAKENKRLEPLKIGKNTREIELLYAQSPKMLAWQDAFRTYDWEKAFPSPEATISQVKQLLALI